MHLSYFRKACSNLWIAPLKVGITAVPRGTENTRMVTPEWVSRSLDRCVPMRQKKNAINVSGHLLKKTDGEQRLTVPLWFLWMLRFFPLYCHQFLQQSASKLWNCLYLSRQNVKRHQLHYLVRGLRERAGVNLVVTADASLLRNLKFHLIHDAIVRKNSNCDFEKASATEIGEGGDCPSWRKEHNQVTEWNYSMGGNSKSLLRNKKFSFSLSAVGTLARYLFNCPSFLFEEDLLNF